MYAKTRQQIIPAGDTVGHQLRGGAGGAGELLVSVGLCARGGGLRSAQALLVDEVRRAQVLVAAAIVEVLHHAVSAIGCFMGEWEARVSGCG